MKPPRKPTSLECEKGTPIDGGPWVALWSPQLGGYVGRAAVFDNGNDHNNERNGCFDVAVWHDGEFPSDTPIVLHCCSAEQFVEFGQAVLKIQKGRE